MNVISVWCPCVRCLNPDCRPIPHRQIFLPHPNPRSIFLSQPDWPTDGWTAYIACRECGFVSEYKKSDLEWGGSPNLDLWIHNSFRCVEARCDQENCKFPIPIYVLAMQSDTANDLEEILNDGKGTAMCKAGHSLKRPLTVANMKDVNDLV